MKAIDRRGHSRTEFMARTTAPAPSFFISIKGSIQEGLSGFLRALMEKTAVGRPCRKKNVAAINRDLEVKR